MKHLNIANLEEIIIQKNKNTLGAILNYVTICWSVGSVSAAPTSFQAAAKHGVGRGAVAGTLALLHRRI